MEFVPYFRFTSHTALIVLTQQYALFIVSRIIFGSGLAFCVVISPILLQELPHPSQRVTIAGLFNTSTRFLAAIPEVALIRSQRRLRGRQLCCGLAVFRLLVHRKRLVVADRLHHPDYSGGLSLVGYPLRARVAALADVERSRSRGARLSHQVSRESIARCVHSLSLLSQIPRRREPEGRARPVRV